MGDTPVGGERKDCIKTTHCRITCADLFFDLAIRWGLQKRSQSVGNHSRQEEGP